MIPAGAVACIVIFAVFLLAIAAFGYWDHRWGEKSGRGGCDGGEGGDGGGGAGCGGGCGGTTD